MHRGLDNASRAGETRERLALHAQAQWKMTLLEAHKNPVAVGKFAFNEETYEKLISRKTATHSFHYGSGADAKLCPCKGQPFPVFPSTGAQGSIRPGGDAGQPVGG